MSITIDNAAGATGSTGVLSKTQSYTVNANTNGLLLVALSFKGTSLAPTGTSVSYAGVSMTLVPSSRSVSGSFVTELWYLKLPSTGANNISVSWTNAAAIVIGAVSFTGVDQTTPLGTAITNAGSDNAPTLTVSSATGEKVVDVIVTNSNPTYTQGAGQTKTHDNASNIPSPSCKGGGSYEDGTASVVMSWGLGSAQTWCNSGVAVKPVAAAGGRPFVQVIWT